MRYRRDHDLFTGIRAGGSPTATSIDFQTPRSSIDSRARSAARRVCRARNYEAWRSAAGFGAWPRLAQRLEFRSTSLDDVETLSGDIVVSSHACGGLTDRVIDRACRSEPASPCFRAATNLAAWSPREFSGWLGEALAIDTMHTVRLKQRGYRVWTQTIPAGIHLQTPAARRRSGVG
jgi:hypothetical protein